jgi:choice-of-anchor B domain-containing protein
MKIFTTTFLLCCMFSTGLLYAQENKGADFNMQLLGTWDDREVPGTSGGIPVRYSGCWGINVGRREIAILGASNSILFVEVTNPTQPVLLYKATSLFTTTWREFRTYRNRVYAVSDGTSEGLRIFDVSNPSNIRETLRTTTTFSSAHSISIDTIAGRAYCNGTNTRSNGLIVLDLSRTPDAPTLLASVSLPGGYVHDAFANDNMVFASSGDNGLYVYDFLNPAMPRTVTSISTSGYNHNCWPTTDGRYLFYTEEIPSKRPIRVVDLSRMSSRDLQVVRSFIDISLDLASPSDQGAIPHNVVVKGDFLYCSQYEDGLLVYNIANPLDPKLVARYDTHPQNTKYNGYVGSWGNYPGFRSGNLLTLDTQNGMFVLRQTATSSTQTPEITTLTAQLSPNPATQLLTVQLQQTHDKPLPDTWHITVVNTAGQAAIQRTLRYTDRAIVPVDVLPRGMYIAKIWSEDGRLVKTEKLIVD